MSQFVCLSGLPRTGSTLLSAILCQNPEIHAEGNSAVCQLMWDLQQSCINTAKEQLAANNRSDIIFDLVSQIPKIYYKNISEKIIVDKCRSWTLEPNVHMLKNYINPNFKIIVLERNITDIIKSFVKLYEKNDRTVDPGIFLTPQSEPLMRSLGGVQWAKKNNSDNNFLFINYDELISDTKNVIDKIYDFCGWTKFDHDFNNIKVKYPENDDVYQLKGQHDINPFVKKTENDVVLSDEILEKCAMINRVMGYEV
jgi:sulfotransferase